MATAEVVVIGGGVNGSSIAYHLAKAGVKDVVLVERAHLGSGASGKSGALVRMHYTNPYESKLAYESLKIFSNWSEIVGGDSGFQRIGFFQVVAPEYEAQLRQNVADQQRIGINSQIITAEEMKEIEPETNIDGLTYVAYEPDSGFADPNATTYSFARRAQELGVRVMTHTTVTAIRTEGDRVVGVDTTAGPIDAPTVVLAGGAWADRLLKPLGLDLGLISYRSQVVIFRRPYGTNGPRHVFIDTVANSWFRPEGDSGILIGAESGGTGVDPDTFNETVDGDQVEMARAKLRDPLPGGTRGDHARRLGRHVYAQPGSSPDHRSATIHPRALHHGRGQRHLLQDVARHRHVYERVDHHRRANHRRPDAVPRLAIRRGQTLARRDQLRLSQPHHLALGRHED